MLLKGVSPDGDTFLFGIRSITGAPTSVNNLTDATAVGKAVVTASNAAAARAAIGITDSTVATTVKTEAYTANVGDLVVCNASAGGFTVYLPGSPANGSRITIKKIDSTSNTITVQRSGSDVFNVAGGGSTIQVYLPSQTVTVQYHSGIWYVINNSYGQPALDAFYTPLNVSQLKNRNGDTFVDVSQTDSTNHTFLTVTTNPNSSSRVDVGTDTRSSAQNVDLRFTPKGAGQVQIAGTLPTIKSFGASTNADLTFRAQGAGQFNFFADSQPNYLIFRGADNDSPPSILSYGTQSNVSINLVPKGSGKVLLNWNEAVDTSSSQTISGKTFTSPVLSGTTTVYAASPNNPVLKAGSDVSDSTLYIQSKGSGAVVIQPGEKSNCIAFYGANSGSEPYLQASGPDQTLGINVVTKNSAPLKVNGNAVVCETTAATLTNKTMTAQKISGGSGTATISAGTGSPENSVTATVGSIYLRTDGGAGTTLYVKESGSGTTGWVAK